MGLGPVPAGSILDVEGRESRGQEAKSMPPLEDFSLGATGSRATDPTGFTSAPKATDEEIIKGLSLHLVKLLALQKLVKW